MKTKKLNWSEDPKTIIKCINCDYEWELGKSIICPRCERKVNSRISKEWILNNEYVILLVNKKIILRLPIGKIDYEIIDNEITKEINKKKINNQLRRRK